MSATSGASAGLPRSRRTPYRRIRVRRVCEVVPGVDEKEPEDKKARYTFPYGDFERVHRCGVLSAVVRAGQYKYDDIELAAAHLHGMLDTVKGKGQG
jgi:hypothetical protein